MALHTFPAFAADTGAAATGGSTVLGAITAERIIARKIRQSNERIIEEVLTQTHPLYVRMQASPSSMNQAWVRAQNELQRLQPSQGIVIVSEISGIDLENEMIQEVARLRDHKNDSIAAFETLKREGLLSSYGIASAQDDIAKSEKALAESESALAELRKRPGYISMKFPSKRVFRVSEGASKAMREMNPTNVISVEALSEVQTARLLGNQHFSQRLASIYSPERMRAQSLKRLQPEILAEQAAATQTLRRVRWIGPTVILLGGGLATAYLTSPTTETQTVPIYDIKTESPEESGK